MNKYRILVAPFILFTLISCDEYDLIRTNPHDPKSKNFIPDPPSVFTLAAANITTSFALAGGYITNDGGGEITMRGVCWNTSQNPTVSLTTKTQNGIGTGTFLSDITSLEANTVYYLRAYATNRGGTGYGSEKFFKTAHSILTDVDGNEYFAIEIGTQVWMQNNLKTSKYNDGTSIPLVTDETAWTNLSTPGYCWYSNDSAAYGATYGALYNWYTVNTGILCPTGWHEASDTELSTLTAYLGGVYVAGGKMKEAGTTHWLYTNSEATNESGFKALPGGLRNYNGTFLGSGTLARFWTSTAGDPAGSIGCMIRDYDSQLTTGLFLKNYGMSVRCVKD
jgi:uncharacterized protein (TIGR02145 family)